MSVFKGLRARLRSVIHPRAAEARMEDEFRFHLDQEIQKNLAAGMTPTEARRRAHVSFGGLDRHRESMRDGRGRRWLDDLERDVRVGLRGLTRNPVFAAMAVLALGLGIGATTAVFTAVDAILLRPLPFPQGERLVQIGGLHIPFSSSEGAFPKSSPDITDLTAVDGVFDGVAAYAPGGLNLTGAGAPRRVRIGVVTPSLFSTLGVAPLRGRTFTEAEGVPGAHRVAVISTALWRSAYGGDADFFGRPVRLNGHPYEVVGIMPSWFAFPEEAEVWIPLSVPMTPATFEPFRQYMPSRVIGRLAPGVTAERAGHAVRSLFSPYEREGSNPTATAAELVKPLRMSLTADRRAMLLVLLGATALVLLIACANVANLLILRGVGRRREIALRAILGATSRRLVRQLMTESMLIALLGAAFGILLSFAGVRLLEVLTPAELRGIAPMQLDGRVLAFALSLAVATGIGFGMWPALAVRKKSAAAAVKSGGAGTGDSSESVRLRQAFVVGQFAVALILLIGSIVMLRSLHALLSVDPGVEPERVATLEFSLSEAEYPDLQARRGFYETVLEKLEAAPEVTAVAAVNELPLRGEGGVRFPVYPEGRRPEQADLSYMPQALRVTTDYFSAMGVRVLAGRAPQPRADSLEVREVAINEAFAAAHWPSDMSPVGRHLEDPSGERCEIVGVVGNVRPRSLESEIIPQVYYSLLDTPAENAAIVARGRVPADRLSRLIERAVRAVAPTQAVFNVRPMEAVIAETITPRRTHTILISTFGLLALLLTGIGTYGVLAFGVAQRTREIGIRVALGAERRRVIGQVLGEALGLAALGTLIGMAGGWMLVRVLQGLVYGVGPRDPAAFIAAPLVLMAVAILAAFAPTRRATRVDPVEAIRAE